MHPTRKRIPLTHTAVIAAIVTAASVCATAQLQRSEPFEVFEVSNQSLKIRATAFQEQDAVVVAGANYIFESAAAGSDVWTPIMAFRHDDAVKIPRDQVRFVSDNVAYVFMGLDVRGYD